AASSCATSSASPMARSRSTRSTATASRSATACRAPATTRAAASRAGVEVGGARFRPHLTLGRTKFPHDVSAWVRLLDAYTGPRWRADTLTLVASYLGQGPRGRPRHVPMDTFPLSSA
ncbi:MAG TPA: hypothetical protein PK324_09250, partial [Nocardioides sp.]|nr:hypothetical protein [Nocardioides sp.]